MWIVESVLGESVRSTLSRFLLFVIVVDGVSSVSVSNGVFCKM